MLNYQTHRKKKIVREFLVNPKLFSGKISNFTSESRVTSSWFESGLIQIWPSRTSCHLPVSLRNWDKLRKIQSLWSWQNIWDKLKKSCKIGQGQKTLISALHTFWLLLPKFYFWKGTRLSPPKFEIFLIFPNFLRFLVLNCFSTCK